MNIVVNRLFNPNIAQFYGIFFGGQPSLIIQWNQNGTVSDFSDTRLRMNAVEVDRLSLVIRIHTFG